MAKAWLGRLESAAVSEWTLASDLYAGRSFRRIRDVANGLGCRFFVVSAGLGLLDGATAIPSYDLTLSPTGPGALRQRLTHAPLPSEWWASLDGSPFASSLKNLCAGRARVLIALTQPYAEMVGESLANLPEIDRNRLRILGYGLKPYLSPALRQQLIRYDDRLNEIIPGTRLDGASRALAHFAKLVATCPLANPEADQSLVDTALSAVQLPVPASRKRVSDAVLAIHVDRFIRLGLSATNALKRLRSEAQIACEEGRFRRLYEEALG
ncbi:hypothetical protein ABIC75_002844 [Dyella japonica]|uniref:Uncharacterized protein n=1 Tax=Dyella japonica TaxID=231455 RepID=A0ABV2JZ87_9GAMM